MRELGDQLEGRRVVAVVGTDLGLARALADVAGDGALSLVERGALPAAPPEEAALSLHPYADLHPYAGPAQIAANNAEVLVLTGAAAGEVARLGRWRHARLVAWSADSPRAALLAAAGAAVAVAAGRARFAGRSRLGRHRFWLLENARPTRPRPRRYFSPRVGVDGFLSGLTEAGARYVVLRWFDTLPEVAPGEDLDLLVADSDLPVVERALNALPGVLPADVYTVTGLPGTDYRDVAYYPPLIAERVLERRRLLRGRYGVPDPEDAFLALAYHAAYHKGEASGLAPSATEPATVASPEHDYATELTGAADALGITVEPTLDALDEMLDKRGWRPPSDMLARLAPTNPWLARRLRALAAEGAGEDSPGLAVFFLRERAVELGLVDELVSSIAFEGLSILAVRRLDGAARDRVRPAVRGGNWGRGPWPVSGGGPAVAVVALDVMPVAPTAAMLARWPALANARLLIKERLRAQVNARLPETEHCNVLHGSDNGHEAISYLRLAVPEEADELLEEAERLRRSFATGDMPVLRDLTRNGRRAKLELVEHEGRLAVRKTFRPGCERFLARERTAATELAATSPSFLPLLAEGDNWLLLPYVEDTLHFVRLRGRMLSLRAARAAVDVLRFCWEQGFALVDCSPANLLMDRDGRLFVIDAEFLHRYDKRPATFLEAWDVAGVPEDAAIDLPARRAREGWNEAWWPYVGLTVEQLLTEPAWRQRLLRGRHRLLVAWPRRARRSAGLARRRVLGRLRSGRALRRLARRMIG